MSTGKKKPSQKINLINDFEDWYQYIPTFKKHVRKGKKVPNTVKKPTSNIIRLLKSPFPKRPDTLFFSYPKYVDIEKPGTNDEEKISVYNQK